MQPLGPASCLELDQLGATAGSFSWQVGAVHRVRVLESTGSSPRLGGSPPRELLLCNGQKGLSGCSCPLVWSISCLLVSALLSSFDPLVRGDRVGQAVHTSLPGAAAPADSTGSWGTQPLRQLRSAARGSHSSCQAGRTPLLHKLLRVPSSPERPCPLAHDPESLGWWEGRSLAAPAQASGLPIRGRPHPEL